MPSHQKRREPLPRGYQFGDARLPFFAELFGDGLIVARTDYRGDMPVWQMNAHREIEGYRSALRGSRLIVNPDGTLPEQPFAPGLTLRAQGPWNG